MKGLTDKVDLSGLLLWTRSNYTGYQHGAECLRTISEDVVGLPGLVEGVRARDDQVRLDLQVDVSDYIIFEVVLPVFRLTSNDSRYIIPTMAARLIHHSKNIHGDEIVEVKIWEVLKSREKPHGVKFSVVYIKEGRRLLGYDNAEGKGYHRHLLGREEPYAFTDIWRLLRDFHKELARMRGREWDEG